MNLGEGCDYPNCFSRLWGIVFTPKRFSKCDVYPANGEGQSQGKELRQYHRRGGERGWFQGYHFVDAFLILDFFLTAWLDLNTGFSPCFWCIWLCNYQIWFQELGKDFILLHREGRNSSAGISIDALLAYGRFFNTCKVLNRLVRCRLVRSKSVIKAMHQRINSALISTVSLHAFGR